MRKFISIIFVLAAGLGISKFAYADAIPSLEFAFEEIVLLETDTVQVGATSMGNRAIVNIKGGSFEGPNLKGEILSGGWDWQLLRDDGCRTLQADYMIKTDDGVIINVVNKGFSCPNADGTRNPVRTYAVFEPPLGKYQWMGRSPFIGTLEPVTIEGQRAVKIRFFQVK